MIRILYVNNAPFIGGAQITLRNIARRLDRRRFTPIVAIPSSRSEMASFFADGNAEIVLVPMLPLRPLSLASLVGLIRTVIVLRRLIVDRRIALVHTNTQRGGAIGLLLQTLCRIRFVWTVNDLALLWYIRLLTILADRITCVSRAVQSRLPRLSRARLIYNGVEVDDSVVAHAVQIRIDTRARLGIPPDAIVVGNVSRLEPWKGVHVAAAAMAQVLQARDDVWFVQAGDVAPGCEEYARETRGIFGTKVSDRVVFAGFQSDIPRWFVAFDLLVHTPTLVRYGHTEAFGMSVAEAMGYGLPVVATRVGALPEVVEDDTTGLLVPHDRPDLVAEAILVLLSDESRRRAMGAAGRQRQHRLFSQQREVSDFEILYEELVPNQPRRNREVG